MVERLLEPEQKIEIFRKQGAHFNSFTLRECGHMNQEDFLVTFAPRDEG